MAKAKTTSKTPKADIDFESHLWNAANELRGAVAENQYKDYVLSLLFVKHLSERFEIRKEEIKKEFNDPGSDYFTEDKESQNNFLEDGLEYQVKNAYKLPGEATWNYLRNNAEQDDIKVKVDKAFVLIDDILAHRSPEPPLKLFKFNDSINSGLDIHQRNHAFHLKLSKGIDKTWNMAPLSARQRGGHAACCVGVS